ncbi:hypothetical protein [Prescottella agglutinans]|uniref:DUF3263 domain-containing protein n=1 Tax=Prescottella agglutinans TaxID=1644129 RepID=A0ABT6M8K3_9NOCA|nr:hypothetical protein [Prescottella agglutinans]MDH6280639.1 hypothetical protein [Prescottella agglutinans]
MHSYDDQIIVFAQRWQPYGGPAREDVFVAFGITLQEFDARLRKACLRRFGHAAIPRPMTGARG